MPFEPTTWILGFACSEGTKRLIDVLGGNIDRKCLTVAQDWANRLPPELALHHPDSLFQSEDSSAGSERSELQKILVDGKIPSPEIWTRALTEQWMSRRNQLGQEAQAFFLAEEDRVVPHLRNLANALRTVFILDEKIGKTSAYGLLTDIVDHQALAIPNRPKYLRDSGLEVTKIAIAQTGKKWREMLFIAALKEERENLERNFRDLEEGFMFCEAQYLNSPIQASEWLEERGHELMNLIGSWKKIMLSISRLGKNIVEAPPELIVRRCQTVGYQSEAFIKYGGKFLAVYGDDNTSRSIKALLPHLLPSFQEYIFDYMEEAIARMNHLIDGTNPESKNIGHTELKPFLQRIFELRLELLQRSKM